MCGADDTSRALSNRRTPVDHSAGVAWAALDTYDVGQSITGWVAGVGVESFVTDTISVKAEDLHHDFGSVYVEGYSDDFDITAETFKVGVNFHFWSR